jgi:hypothetical protein
MSIEYSPAVRQAFRDWNDSSVYLDSNGNYRVRTRSADGYLSPNGKIAPWNKEVKRLFISTAHFHLAAQEAKEGQTRRFCASCEASLTETDQTAGYCTNCNEPLKG